LARSGVRYAESAATLNPVVLAQAHQELHLYQQNATDSALSLLSGLHRKDVRAFREQADVSLKQVQADGSAWGKPSAANQVVTRWLSLDWPEELPLAGDSPSFDELARQVSKDFHPRAVLNEMVRLGVATESDGKAKLLRNAFVPDAKHKEAQQIMAGAVSDHLAAGVHNLNAHGGRKFLEQSGFADGLTAKSVQKLNLLANTLWEQVLDQVVAAAIPLCEQDSGKPEAHRFRLGLFTYAAPEFARPEDNEQT